jgi:hypothetical protein
MPRIRCHYLDCVFLDENYCSAAQIELDPDTGCKTYSANVDQSTDDNWDEEENEEELEEWDEDSDEDEDEDLWSEEDTDTDDV